MMSEQSTNIKTVCRKQHRWLLMNEYTKYSKNKERAIVCPTKQINLEVNFTFVIF